MYPDLIILMRCFIKIRTDPFISEFSEKFAVTVTGFLAGVYLMINLMQTFDLNLGPWLWFAYLAGGMVGTLLVLWLFDWALILLSTMISAALITQSVFSMMQIEIASRSLIFMVLLIVGIVVQYNQKYEPSD